MSETAPLVDTPMSVPEKSDSKKRPAETPLSDLKKQQLQDARQKKTEKATQRATELLELKTRILQTESSLKDTEQKLSQRISNTEVEAEVQKDAAEKRPRVVTKEPEVVEKPKPASWDLSKMESPTTHKCINLICDW